MSQPSPLATPLPWNLVAADYATDVVPVFSRFAEKAVTMAGVGKGARVLDVAAGPGTLAFIASAAGARVTAIDFSSEMIDRLRVRSAQQGVEIDARVGDGQALPFDDASFDHAFSMFGLMFFPDRAKGFRELCRVLVPGGRAVVSSWVPAERVPWFGQMWGALREFVPSLPQGSPFPLSRPEECLAEMREGGFEAVKVVEVTESQSYVSTHQLWSGTTRTSAPIALLREKLGPSEWPRVEAGVLSRLLDMFGEGPQITPMPANLIVGRRPA
jgi:ubiquinone/menaquinone biosynthesis C-methylase UbiE